jgi:hypothetical protein
MIIFNYKFTRIRGREGVILSKKKRVWYPGAVYLRKARGRSFCSLLVVFILFFNTSVRG